MFTYFFNLAGQSYSHMLSVNERTLSPEPPASHDVEVGFLMEQLLDEQEKVTRLEDELERLRSAVTLRSCVEDWSARSQRANKDAPALSSNATDSLRTLLALRDSLVSSLERVEEELQDRYAIRSSPPAFGADVLPHTAVESDIDERMQHFKLPLIRFNSSSELEEVYRIGIRTAYDAHRLLTLAADKVIRLSSDLQFFCSIQRHNAAFCSNGLLEHTLPAFCLSSDWVSQIRKALIELVLAWDMRGQRLPQVPVLERVASIAVYCHTLQPFLRWIQCKYKETKSGAERHSDMTRNTSASTTPTTTAARAGTQSGAQLPRSSSPGVVPASRSTSATARTQRVSPRSETIPDLRDIHLPAKHAAPAVASAPLSRPPLHQPAAHSGSSNVNVSPQRSASCATPVTAAVQQHRSRLPQETPGERSVSASSAPLQGLSPLTVGARGLSPVRDAGGLLPPARVTLRSPSPKSNRLPLSEHIAQATIEARLPTAAHSNIECHKQPQVAFEEEDSRDAEWEPFDVAPPAERGAEHHVTFALNTISAATPESATRRRQPQETHTAAGLSSPPIVASFARRTQAIRCL